MIHSNSEAKKWKHWKEIITPSALEWAARGPDWRRRHPPRHQPTPVDPHALPGVLVDLEERSGRGRRRDAAVVDARPEPLRDGGGARPRDGQQVGAVDQLAPHAGLATDDERGDSLRSRAPGDGRGGRRRGRGAFAVASSGEKQAPLPLPRDLDGRRGRGRGRVSVPSPAPASLHSLGRVDGVPVFLSIC